VLFKLLRKKFGYGTNKGIAYALRDKLPIVRKEEDHLIKGINEGIKFYFSRKIDPDGLNKDKGFGTFNPLTSHLYYKISIQYFKLFISKLSFNT
jgi:hypothetical protein